VTRQLVVFDEAAEEIEAQIVYYREHAGENVALWLINAIEATYQGLLEDRIVGLSTAGRSSAYCSPGSPSPSFSTPRMSSSTSSLSKPSVAARATGVASYADRPSLAYMRHDACESRERHPARLEIPVHLNLSLARAAGPA
jgi:hypothetical protein